CNGDNFTNLADLGCVITKFRGGTQPPPPGETTKTVAMAEITFSSDTLGERFALDNLIFNPVLTFDEPEFFPPGPIDGKIVQGVTFFFTVEGIPSTDAAVGLSTGPEDTPLITPPIIEGDATGLLTLIFNPPVGSVSFNFALTALVDIPNGATISLFDESDNLLGTASADATVPLGFIFAEGTLGLSTSGLVKTIEKRDSVYPPQPMFSGSDTGWERQIEK
ncbi:hypothetical protein MYX76_16730, partial [Desulfobacterota bacterium AH_259_B03_O07]|nr:hypothetical protein [Desulfobacterota bacterium AH_259_B03_O07]